jgi:hypothetical protein
VMPAAILADPDAVLVRIPQHMQIVVLHATIS